MKIICNLLETKNEKILASWIDEDSDNNGETLFTPVYDEDGVLKYVNVKTTSGLAVDTKPIETKSNEFIKQLLESVNFRFE